MPKNQSTPPNSNPKKQAKKSETRPTPLEGERLQKYIAASGACSRRKAEALILNGQVQVNGVVVTTLGTRVLPSDTIALDGEPLALGKRHLYLFHKPRGVLSTAKDPFDRRCLASFTEDLPVRVFSIGRLDYDVSGLLLLTNDGELKESLLHPRNGIPRTYWARVAGVVPPSELSTLIGGIKLEDGMAHAVSARILPHDGTTVRYFTGLKQNESVVELVVNVGKKHFVKRLLAAWGHPVEALVRVAFGPYQLGRLPPGALKEVPCNAPKKN